MFTVSFRILIGEVAGQKLFLNGSAHSDQRLSKGTSVVVIAKSNTDNEKPFQAEVIESVETSRASNEYLWECFHVLRD